MISMQKVLNSFSHCSMTNSRFPGLEHLGKKPLALTRPRWHSSRISTPCWRHWPNLSQNCVVLVYFNPIFSQRMWISTEGCVLVFLLPDPPHTDLLHGRMRFTQA